MKEYSVMIPIAGYAIVVVEAKNEEEAKELAFEKVTLDDIEEWEAHEKIVEGNIFHGNCNSVDVQLEYDYEE